MTKKRVPSRNVLVLWRWTDALDANACHMKLSRGSQMRSRRRGDRLFVCATHKNRLYLLGIILVRQVQRYRREYKAVGRNLAGPFRIIRLESRILRRIRFRGTDTDRLNLSVPLAFQVRTHRYLSPPSAELLNKTLRTGKAREHQAKQLQAKELAIDGREILRSMSVRERKNRAAALAYHGTQCKVCEFRFDKYYHDNCYEYCVEVHHLHELSKLGKFGRRPTLEDLIVVCPNCHRALHRSRDPSDWKALRDTVARFR